jgi:protein-S-isoprenylcysteine O-methyltransferase Ste14
MYLKGIEKLREKLPGYPGKRIYLLLILAGASFLIGLAFLILIDIFPRLLSSNTFFIFIEPLTPIIGSFILTLIGFLLIYKVWYSRETYKEKYKDKAYQKVIKYGVMGVLFVATTVIHAYIPIDLIFPRSVSNSLTILFSTSLLSFIPSLSGIEFIIRTFISIIFVLLTLLTMRRAILTFGIDYMAVVYLYYPEESEIQDYEIYSVLRHPAYSAILMLCIGAIFARFSLYSLIFTSITLIGLIIHIRFVEEKELIERFGESYIEYRKEVPALLVKPRDIGRFFKFLFKGAD